MWKSVARWTTGLLALFFIGPLASFLTGSLRGPTGGRDASLLLCTSPASGVLVGIGVIALVIIGGVLAGRLVGLKSGMLVAGFIAAWAAWRLGTIDAILRVALTGNSAAKGVSNAGTTTLITLALEGFLVAISALLVTTIVEAAARSRGPNDLPDSPARPPGLFEGMSRLFRETFAGAPALAGLGAGALAGAAGVWLIAFEPLKGQAVMAAVIGTIAAGAAGQLTSQSMGGKATLLSPVASMAVVALAGPIIMLIAQGSHLLDALYSQKLLAFGVPLSLDWAAGTLLGAPIGLSWAGVMLERHEPKTA